MVTTAAASAVATVRTIRLPGPSVINSAPIATKRNCHKQNNSRQRLGSLCCLLTISPKNNLPVRFLKCSCVALRWAKMPIPLATNIYRILMSQPPETRPSLIARLKNRDDQVAWEEFVEIYRPVVFRIAIKKGLQPADAEDVTQTVMLSVSRAVERWVPDPAKAKFRTWLGRVAHNAIINAVVRRKPDRGSGDSEMLAMLAEQPCETGPHSELIQLEQRRECFRLAARQIENEFQPETWQAFWLTAIENVSAEEVAKRLNKKTGSIYTARSRVMRRLQQRVQQIGGEDQAAVI